MSLILDALNRSRREDEAVPGLDTYHPVASKRRTPGRYMPWVALAVALLIIAWLLLDRDRAPVPAASAPMSEVAENLSSALSSVKGQLQANAEQQSTASATPPAATEAATTPISTGPAAEPASQAPSAQLPPQVAAQGSPQSVAASAATEPVAQPADEPPGDSVDTAAQAASEPAAESASESATDPAVAALYQRAPDAAGQAEPAVEAAKKKARQPEPAAMAARDEEEPVDLERLLVQARDEVENAQLVEHPAPFLAALSQQTKNDIPTIYYQRHDYADSAARSSVVLNNKTLRVGGSPVSGMRVEEILPDSVILSYRGTQFRLRALNSWINL